MDDTALQALAQHLSDNLGNKLTAAVATGIFNIVAEIVKKQAPPEPTEPTQPA